MIMWLMVVGMAGAADYSGTLPVLFISTTDQEPITSKTDYLSGTYYLDAMGIEGYEDIGSAELPLPLEIRGRGNYTWYYFDKKSFRLKLGAKQRLLGMNKSRHFALLAHADDNVGFLRNTTSFEISRRMGMPFTPEQRPVEVVLNGEYMGLYFLTETVRVGKDRVNISEQADCVSRADSITGGWLVEIDNYEDKKQLQFPVEGTDLECFWVTYHSPDSLSEAQHDYLYGQFEDILQAFYAPGDDSTRWERLIDVHSLAMVYVIDEVVDHVEGFTGSCFLYKDYLEERWKLGPIWDMGHAFNARHSKQKFIYDGSYFPVSIIKRIATFPRFQEEVMRVWDDFYPDGLEGLEDFMNAFLDEIAPAAAVNADYWPTYGNRNVKATGAAAFSRLRTKVAWLESQWRPVINRMKGEHEDPFDGVGDVNGDGHVDVGDIMAVINYMAGTAQNISKEVADVNGDGAVNVGDIMAVIEIMAINN